MVTLPRMGAALGTERLERPAGDPDAVGERRTPDLVEKRAENRPERTESVRRA
jgi:hypothetical protein